MAFYYPAIYQPLIDANKVKHQPLSCDPGSRVFLPRKTAESDEVALSVISTPWPNLLPLPIVVCDPIYITITTNHIKIN